MINQFQIFPYEKSNVGLSYQFLMDTFLISFGSDKKNWPNNLGSYSFEKYSNDIERMVSHKEYLFYSVWFDERIVGQIEISTKNIPNYGYISFYYLLPEFRNRGLGKQLDDFSVNEIKKQGAKCARLTVSENNSAGRRFYEKNGWVFIGVDPDRPMGLVMEKNLY